MLLTLVLLGTAACAPAATPACSDADRRPASLPEPPPAEVVLELAGPDCASPWQAFWHVTLPQAWRGVLGGALTTRAREISDFGAVVILA